MNMHDMPRKITRNFDKKKTSNVLMSIFFKKLLYIKSIDKMSF